MKLFKKKGRLERQGGGAEAEEFYSCSSSLLQPSTPAPSISSFTSSPKSFYLKPPKSSSSLRSITSRISSGLRSNSTSAISRGGKAHSLNSIMTSAAISTSTTSSSASSKEKSRLLNHFPILKENSLVMKSTKGFIIPATERPRSALIGKLAPDFLLNDHLNRKCSLHATIALGRPIVLFFFPLAGSPHCTTESCSFRDAIGTSPIFNDLEAIVIGISQDPPSRSKRFVDEHHLGYRILHDEDREVMEAWGVKKVMLGLLDSRCTFVIDNNGIVRGMAEGFFDSVGHRVFAERWLTRIEHELSGRVRRVEEIPSSSAGDLIIANDEKQAKTRVTYGAERSAAGGGIGGVPRYGAAPSDQKLSESQIAKDRQRKAGFKALLGNLTSAGVLDARDDLEELQINGSSSDSPYSPSSSNRFGKASWSTRGRMASANENPSAKWSPVATDYGGSVRTTNSDGNSLKGKRASWKSLTNRPRSSSGSVGGSAFSRSRRQQEALNEPLPSPSIPPTYQNVDTDEAQFSEVDRFGSSSYLQQSRSRTDSSDQRQGLGIQSFNRSDPNRTGSLRRPPGSSGSNDVQFIAKPSSSSNEKLREAEDPKTPRSTSSTNYDASTWATRSSASSQSASTAETSVGSHGRSRSEALRKEKEKAEYDSSGVPLPLLPPIPRHQPQPLPSSGRRSRGPYDVPRDAEDEEDDDNEEFVALNANGQLELTGRRIVRPNGSNGSDGTGSVSSSNTVTLQKGNSTRRPGTGESSTSTSSKRAHSRSNSATSFDGTPLRPQDFARTYPKDEARDHLVLADGSKLAAPPILSSSLSSRTASPSPSLNEAETTQVNVARRVEPVASSLTSPVVGRAKASVVTSPISRSNSILISPRPGSSTAAAAPKLSDSLTRSHITSNASTNEAPQKVSIESIRSSSMLNNDEDLSHARLIPKKSPAPQYAPPPAPSPNSSPMLNPSQSGQFVPSFQSPYTNKNWQNEDPFSSNSNKSKTNNPSSSKINRSPQITASPSSSRSHWGESSKNHNPSDIDFSRRPSNHSVRSTGTFGVQHSPPEPFIRNNGNGSHFDSLHSDAEFSDQDVGAESNSAASSYKDKERFTRNAMKHIDAL